MRRSARGPSCRASPAQTLISTNLASLFWTWSCAQATSCTCRGVRAQVCVCLRGCAAGTFVARDRPCLHNTQLAVLQLLVQCKGACGLENNVGSTRTETCADAPRRHDPPGRGAAMRALAAPDCIRLPAQHVGRPSGSCAAACAGAGGRGKSGPAARSPANPV